MEIVNIQILKLILVLIVYLVLILVINFINKKIDFKSYKILNPQEYFPDEEIHSLRQLFYLIMMGLFFVNILYLLMTIGTDVYYLALFDIALSLYVAVSLDKTSLKNKILAFLLIPLGSLTYVIFGNTLVGLLDFIHVPVYIYMIKIYFDKFREYTESNGLGIAILLLFTIVFLSFLFTQVAESVNPLDSLVMVSNAFTSNGYTVLGKTIPGKIDGVILVWSGYILSGVGTATLASAILIRHFNNKIEEYDDRLRKMDAKLDELKGLIKKD